MNQFFFDNFDSDTAGSLPAWFNAVSGMWAVVSDSTVAFSSSNVLENASHADLDTLILAGGGGVSIPATADMIVSFVSRSMTSAIALHPAVRSDAIGQNCYSWEPAQIGANIGLKLYKRVGGSFSNLTGLVDTGVVLPSSGTPIHFKFAAIGSTISGKAWIDGTPEPVSYQVIETDTSIITAGYFALFQAGSGSAAIDDLSISGNSSLAASSLSSSGIGSTTLTATATSATGGTGPYAYQWYRSPTSNFIPNVSNLISGATSLTLNDNDLSPSTTYYYQLISTDNIGSIIWSHVMSVTTASGVATDFTISGTPETTNPGTTTGNYTITLNGNPFSSITVSLSDSSANGTFLDDDGARITSLTLTNASPKTFSYLPSNSATGTIILHCAASGGITTSHDASCVISEPAAVGTAHLTYTGVNTVFLSASEATGGSGSFTHQWYRSTISGAPGTALIGQTAETLIDNTPSPATTYYYSLKYTDTGSGAVGYTTQVSATTLAASALELLGGIGDSIMQGYGGSGANKTGLQVMVDHLNFHLPTRQFTIPTGGNAGASGTTSTNWLPSGSLLPAVAAAFAMSGTTRIVLLLGPSDAKGSVATPVNTYQSNIKAILAYLFANVSSLRSVHLLPPIYQPLPSGDLSVMNSDRIIRYANALASVADGSSTFFEYALDTYNYFQLNPGYFSSDDIHPGDLGQQSMGAIWALSVLKALMPTSTNVGSRAAIANA